MFVYRTFRRGSESDVNWTTLDAALRQLKKRILGKGPYGVKMRGWEDYQEIRGLRTTMHRVKRLTLDARPGDQAWVRTHGGSIYCIAIGKEELTAVPPFPPVRHTVAAKQIWDFVFTEVQRLEDTLGRNLRVVSMGVYNYRYISGTHTWSQHAWGNAFDFIILHDGVVDQGAMARMVEELNSKSFVAQVLWHVPDHYGHAHVSGAPLQTGTP